MEARRAHRGEPPFFTNNLGSKQFSGNAHIAGRILDRFKAHFGQDNVFIVVNGNNQIVQGDRSLKGKLSGSNRSTAISRNGVCRSRPALAPATWLISGLPPFDPKTGELLVNRAFQTAGRTHPARVEDGT